MIKKYRILGNSKEIEVIDGIPYIQIRELLKIEEYWKVSNKLIPLEEIKNE